MNIEMAEVFQNPVVEGNDSFIVSTMVAIVPATQMVDFGCRIFELWYWMKW